MRIRCLTGLLIGCCLLHGPSAHAKPNPRAAVVSTSPDSALMHLTVAWVNAGPMREGGPVRWRYRPGLPPGWASPATNDRSWLLARTQFLLGEGPPGWHGTGCFRLHFTLDSALLGQPLCLRLLHEGASEIYLDGRLLGRYGTVGPSLETTRGFFPRHEMLSFALRTAGPHLLAVRYAKFGKWAFNRAGFSVWVASPEHILAHAIEDEHLDMLHLFVSVAIGVLTLLHFLLFLFYRSQRANLYYSLYTGVLAGAGLLHYLRVTLADEDMRWWVQLGSQASEVLAPLLLLAFVYSVCQVRLTQRWLGLLLLGGAVLLVLMQPTVTDKRLLPVYYGLMLMPWLDMLRVLGRALWQRRLGVGLVAVGVVATIRVDGFALWDLFNLWPNYFSMGQQVVTQLGLLVLPVCMSAYLAREFATTRHDLEAQLRQVEQLSAQTLAQEQEKQALLSAQNETLEQQVSARTGELQRSLTNLRATQAQLIQKEKMASLGELTAGIAHEIQNPLNFVNNFSEVSAELVAEVREERAKGLAADQALQEKLLDNLDQNLGKIHQHGQRAASIVRGMLEHSRQTTGERQPTDLNALADACLRLAYQGLRIKDKTFACALKTSFCPDLPVVEAVSADLSRVLLNLFSNAFYAVQKRQQLGGEANYTPTVDVLTRQTGNRVEIQVKDNGTGMSAAVQPKIFQPFFTTKPTGEGTGLGLSLSYDIITKGHGGSLAVESQEGAGATFVVGLPVNGVAAQPAP